MKKLLFFLIVLGNYSFAQTWSMVGVPFFSNSFFSSYTGWPFIAIDPIGTPYITYCGNTTPGSVTVMKFNGNSWVYVGIPGFSAGDADGPTIAFDNNGSPYVAYNDDENSDKASVMKFNGSNWVYVGTPGFTPGCASFTSIAFDKNNIPYMAFRDQGDTLSNSWPNGFRASVMKFDGTSWVYVGAPGFSAGTGPSGATYTSLAIDKNNTLYITYSDFGNGSKATVKKFDGSNWVNVGAGVISTGGVNNTSIAIGSDNAPYVAFKDGANGGKATAMKFDGSSWVTIGSAGFTAGSTDDPFISLDANDTPFVVYKDYANGQAASVMQFDGINWVQIGVPGFSAPPKSEVYRTTLAIDKNKGILYVAYNDVRYDSAWQVTQQGATVMKFDTRAPAATITAGGSNALCPGDSVTLMARLSNSTGPYVYSWSPGAQTTSAITVSPTATITYTVSITDTTSYLATTTVIIHPVPIVYLGNDTTITGSILLNAGNSGSTFNWNTGNTTQTFTVNSSGTYYVTVTNIHGCSALDTIMVNIVATTNINETEHTNGFSIYPNPSGSNITISITVPDPKDEFTLRVWNSLGSTIYCETIKEICGSLTKQIDLSFLPKGIYFIELQSASLDSPSKKSEVKKIVLQ